jgi:hypothetical protein
MRRSTNPSVFRVLGPHNAMPHLNAILKSEIAMGLDPIVGSL